MKRRLVFSCIALSLSASPAFAERSETQQQWLEGGTFTALTIAGTVAAGPAGFVAGALGGAFLAHETRQAHYNEIQMNKNRVENRALEQSLMQNEQHISQLQKDLAQKLTFQVLFATGEDTLNELDKQRVEKLARYLTENPQLRVNLDGHADIRGTDEYNNVLSAERARAVRDALVEFGVESDRIQFQGLGTSYAKAPLGDSAGHAKDRKVVIELTEPSMESSVAQQGM